MIITQIFLLQPIVKQIRGKVYRLTPESTDSRNLTVEEVIKTEGAVKCIAYW